MRRQPPSSERTPHWMLRIGQAAAFELPLLAAYLRERGWPISRVFTDDQRALREGPPAFLRVIWSATPHGHERKALERAGWGTYYDHRFPDGRSAMDAEELELDEAA